MMILAVYLQGRFFLRADIDRYRAARVKPAALGRVERAGHITLQDDALPFNRRIGDRDSRHKRLGIRVQGVPE